MKNVIIYTLLLVIFGVFAVSAQDDTPVVTDCTHIQGDSTWISVYPTVKQYNPFTDGFNNGSTGNGNNNTSNPPTVFSDYRLINWVHGTKGDDDDWDIASIEIENRYKSVTHRPEYDQDDWNTAVTDLINDTKGDTYWNVTTHTTIDGDGLTVPDPLDPKKSFAIAHSLGGNISRDVQREFDLGTPVLDSENTFHGIVTFGTPHNGAELAANQDMLGDWIYDGATKFVNAKSYEAIQNSFLGNASIEWLVQKYAKIDLDNPIGNLETDKFIYLPAIWDKVWQGVIDIFLPGIVDDLKPSANSISTLQNYSNNKPSVAFYGVEDDPVFFKYLTSSQFSGGINTPFANNGDETIEDEVQINILELQEQEEFYQQAYYNYDDPDACNWLQWMTSPFPCALLQVILDATENWSEDDLYTAWKFYELAGNWLEDANNSWKIFIGQGEMNQVSIGYICSCTDLYDDNGYWTDYITTNPASCNDDDEYQPCQLGEEVFGFEFNEITESDGLITASSAMDFPNVGARDQMNSTNHSQMRNNSELEDKLTVLFEEGIYGDWFNLK